MEVTGQTSVVHSALSTARPGPGFVASGSVFSVTSAGGFSSRLSAADQQSGSVELSCEALKNYVFTAVHSTGSNTWFTMFPVFVQRDWLAPEPRTQIAAVRDSFGTSIQRLATWLRVERATVYDWLDEGTPRPNARARLEILYQLALLWRRMRLGSIDLKPIALNGGDCLDAKLAAEMLSETQLRNLIVSIANASPNVIERRSLGDELAARGAAEIPERLHTRRKIRRSRVRMPKA